MSRNALSGILAFALGFCLMFAFKGSSNSIARYSSEKNPGAWESTGASLATTIRRGGAPD